MRNSLVGNVLTCMHSAQEILGSLILGIRRLAEVLEVTQSRDKVELLGTEVGGSDGKAAQRHFPKGREVLDRQTGYRQDLDD